MVAAGAKEGDVLVVQGDLTDVGVQKRLISETITAFKKINILVRPSIVIGNNCDVQVNNAGAATLGDGIDAPLEEFDKMLMLNTKSSVSDFFDKRLCEHECFSVVAMMQLAHPHLKETKGEIVNISSVAGQHNCVSSLYP